MGPRGNEGNVSLEIFRYSALKHNIRKNCAGSEVVGGRGR